MKTFTVIVSRYNSIALNIQANTIEEAEQYAMKTALDGCFEELEDQYEIADSYEENQ
jgi:predicted RNase H-like HicB family nuclease